MTSRQERVFWLILNSVMLVVAAPFAAFLLVSVVTLDPCVVGTQPCPPAELQFTAFFVALLLTYVLCLVSVVLLWMNRRAGLRVYSIALAMLLAAYAVVYLPSLSRTALWSAGIYASLLPGLIGVPTWRVFRRWFAAGEDQIPTPPSP